MDVLIDYGCEFERYGVTQSRRYLPGGSVQHLKEIADVLVQRQYIKRIERVRHVGELDGEGMHLPHRKILEQNLIRFADESRTFEYLALHDLLLRQVLSVALLSLFHVELLFGC